MQRHQCDAMVDMFTRLAWLHFESRAEDWSVPGASVSLMRQGACAVGPQVVDACVFFVAAVTLITRSDLHPLFSAPSGFAAYATGSILAGFEGG